jgi:uncharacterized protein (UPF0264 family)
MKLLVSVRSPEEALAAMKGGADLIDVKEPIRGLLGRADDSVIGAVIEAVAGRAPVSAAMGELKETAAHRIPKFPLTYLKWGLAGCKGLPWRERMRALQSTTVSMVVPCAYVDADRAEAPLVDEVAEFVIQHRFPVMLIDTWAKDGRGLFSWMLAKGLAELANALHDQGVELALAGSLTVHDVPALHEAGGDWMAVRGAVCESGLRERPISASLVSSLRAAIDMAITG